MARLALEQLVKAIVITKSNLSQLDTGSANVIVKTRMRYAEGSECLVLADSTRVACSLPTHVLILLFPLQCGTIVIAHLALNMTRHYAKGEVAMLALLCTLAIGQVEDIAVLHERYEKAQASYDSMAHSYERSLARYEESRARIQQWEARWKEMDARLGNLKGSSTSSSVQRLQEVREKSQRQWFETQRMMRNHLNQLKPILLWFKQRAEEAKWKYETAAGRLREHWA